MGEVLLWCGLAGLWAMGLGAALYRALNRQPLVKEPRHDR